VESNSEAIAAKGVALDTVWVLLAAILVMFMQPGFALLEAGFTRAKNACNILMKNLMDFALGSSFYCVIGFGVMFGAANLLLGTSGFFLNDTGGTFDSLSWLMVPLECKYFFQLVFLCYGCHHSRRVNGGKDEVCCLLNLQYRDFRHYLSGVRPLELGWYWLAEIGMWDFAVSTVVHSVGVGWRLPAQSC
jgi:Amt family ammonium transporter